MTLTIILNIDYYILWPDSSHSKSDNCCQIKPELPHFKPLYIRVYLRSSVDLFFNAHSAEPL